MTEEEYTAVCDLRSLRHAAEIVRNVMQPEAGEILKGIYAAAGRLERLTEDMVKT